MVWFLLTQALHTLEGHVYCIHPRDITVMHLCECLDSKGGLKRRHLPDV